MREILFRGKRKDNGEWVYGYLVKSDGVINQGNCYILPTMADFSYGDNGNKIRIGCFVEISPPTVGQYTGLSDAAGKKIIEGDVCKVSGEDGLFVIQWSIDEAMFRIEGDGLSVDFDSFYPEELEVIGNIHDDKTLLKNQEGGE